MIQVLSVVFLFFQMSVIVPGAWMNFSAYNVDGWFPSNFASSSMAPKLWAQLTFSTQYDQDLIPHTLHHYISVLGTNSSDSMVALHVTDPKDPKNLVNRAQ